MIDPETGRSERVPEYIEAHVSGFDALSKHIRDFTPKRDGADLRGRSGAAARGRAHPRPDRAGDHIPGDRDLATRPRDGQRALSQDLLREGHLAGPNRELSRALPVVVHTRRERWSAPLGVRTLTAPGPEALAPLQPEAACVLLDGPTLPDDDARRNPAAALIAVQSCAEASPMPERMAGLLRRSGEVEVGKALCDGSRKMLEARFGGELPRRWTEKPAMDGEAGDVGARDGRVGAGVVPAGGVRRASGEAAKRAGPSSRSMRATSGRTFELAVPLAAGDDRLAIPRNGAAGAPTSAADGRERVCSIRAAETVRWRLLRWNRRRRMLRHGAAQTTRWRSPY